MGSQLIWSLHFKNNQFSHCYFQVTVNLVPTVRKLIEFAYMTDGIHNVAQIKLKYEQNFATKLVLALGYNLIQYLFIGR